MPPKATQTAAKRIAREIGALKDLPSGIEAEPHEDNIYKWRCTIAGPDGSPFEGGLFRLAVDLPPDYPFRAPSVTFLTKIYHPNISASGAICVDILKPSGWSPALSVSRVLLSISSLLTDPNPADPLVPEIGQQYTRDRSAFERACREWVRLHAQPPNGTKPKKDATQALPVARNPASAQPQQSTSDGSRPPKRRRPNAGVASTSEASPAESGSRESPIAVGEGETRKRSVIEID